MKRSADRGCLVNEVARKDNRSENPVARASRIGQSIWLDDLSRDLIESGGLKKYIDVGLRGVTSNPKIFAAAISEGSAYDQPIQELAHRGRSAVEIYETLAVEDIQAAADQLRPYFQRGLPHDGFVSLEVSPRLAHEARGTIEEAQRLCRAVDRPNVLIKVPATEEGLEAIRALIGQGINVNVTLLFSLPRYREVALAYTQGVEDALDQGRNVRDIHSVASFFLSRIDVLVDSKLDERIESGPNADAARALRGKCAIASAKLAYRSFQETFKSDRFQALAQGGATPQRLLWGSTSVKDSAYDELMYANALVGPDTVDTLPAGTFRAFVERGKAEDVLAQEVDEAAKTLGLLEDLGIKMTDVTEQLLREGVRKFDEPFTELLDGLEAKIAA